MSVAANINDRPIRHDAEVIPALLESMNLGNYLPPYKQTSVSPRISAGVLLRREALSAMMCSKRNAGALITPTALSTHQTSTR